MWWCPFPIYICGIKFLFGCIICPVSGIAAKAAIVLSIFSFTNCYGYGFMLNFSQAWDFITMLWSIDTNTITTSISAKENIFAL